MGRITGGPVCLSIAGFDPSAGAGVLADLKTMSAYGIYGVSCITALTVQSTAGVSAVHPVEPAVLRAMLQELADDFQIAGVKIGMLATAEVAEAVGAFLESGRFATIVLDPVLRSSSGAELLSEAGRHLLLERLIPLATVMTPNREEYKALGGEALLAAGGARAVVVTGGDSDGGTAHDWLMTPGGRRLRVEGASVQTTSTHGTGCTFSSALLCELVLGRDLEQAVAGAKRFVTEALRAARPMGRGRGPVEHFWGRI